MEIKYSKKKQEIRKDAFLDFVGQARQFIDAKSNTLLAVGIAVCLVVAGFGVYRYVSKTGEVQAKDAFGKAMVSYINGDDRNAVEGFKNVVDNHKNSPQAVYSAYILGNIMLRQEKIDEAVQWFKSAVSASPKTGFVGADAYEGLAACYDAKGNREEALDCLKKALADSRIRYRFPSLAWKAALVSKELGRDEDAKRYCQQIVADTISQAAAYRQKAENFIVEIDAPRSN
ncbi:MAG TPA: tetratricopeptide repeat protein [Chitinivibrionales bacterium]|nr:tetratricopeptide repeat protein [Chitinivibrionales bacterium]